MSRVRLKLEIRRARKPALVVLAGFALMIVCAAYVLANVGKSLYTSHQTFAVEFADGGGVVGGGRQEVRFKGIQAGSISDIKLQAGEPTATMTLYKQFGRVYRNARIALRPATPLEDMYFDILDRGTPSAGLATKDDPILARRVTTSVQPEAVLDALSPDVRAHMATVMSELGLGLKDRGDDLSTAFAQAVPFVEQADRLVHELAVRKTLTATLVSDTATLTRALGERDTELRRLVGTASTTLRTVAGRTPQLEATLAELPPTLRRIDSSFATVRDLIPSLNRAADGLLPVAQHLPSSLRGLRDLSAVLGPAATQLRNPVRRLTPLANALVPVSSALRRTVSTLSPLTGDINYITHSVAGCSAALEGFFQYTASLTKIGDHVNGPPGRGDLNIGLDSSSLVKDPNVYVPKSCAPGAPIGGVPGTGGNLQP